MATHKNTFENGMISDVDIANQPAGSFRYMKNCDLVSQSGNDYVIKDCLGNVRTFTINRAYNSIADTPGGPPCPIFIFSFPTYIVIGHTALEDGGPGEIGKIEFYPYGHGIQPKAVAGQLNSGYIPLYYHNDLNFSKKHMADGVCVPENDLIERIYFSDFFNEPRVFNCADPIFTTYFSSGSLVATQEYMVVEGAIEHPVASGTFYGPGLVAGNVFTASTTTYTATTGTAPIPKVIEYYPVKLLDWIPDRSLGNMKATSLGVGNVNCGSKVYFHRLSTTKGIFTSWSYGSAPVPVGTDNDYINTIPYHNYVGGGTNNTLKNSGYSVNVTIDGIDTDFDFIELACAEYDFLSSAPRQITTVSKAAITGSEMTLSHTGDDNYGDLTIGAITLFPASILKVKSLTTHKNFLILGNTEERQELDIDFPILSVSSFEYPMNVHSDATNCSTGALSYTGAYPASTTANPAAATITPWSRWKVILGNLTTDTVLYNGLNYVTGDVIVGVSSAGGVNAQNTITFTGSASVRPCVTKNKFTDNNGDRVEDAITLTTGFWDLKDPIVAQHCTSMWSTEFYRLAILIFDLKGNPYYARHLIDFQMPDINSKGGLIRSDTFGGAPFYSLNPSGINISGLTIPADIAVNMSGFSIVRAVRDPRIITQGLVTHVGHTAGTPDVYRPGAWIPMSKDNLSVATSIYSYLCPDSNVSAPLKGTIGVLGDTMEQATWIEPFNFTGGKIVRAIGGREQLMTKFLSCVNDGRATRTGTITYFDYVDEGQSLVNLGSGATFENFGQRIAAAAGTDPDHTCIGGGAYSTIDDSEAIGCKKIVFKLEADFEHYNTATNYTNAAVNTKTEKILMNYVKTNYGTPYGGTGADALANTLYISTGHYQQINSTILATVPTSGSNYLFNNIEIMGGDCFLSLIDIGYDLYDNGYARRLSWSWLFPCECNSNYGLRRGRKVSNVGMFYNDTLGTGAASADAIAYVNPSSQTQLEDYSYNKGYSTENQSILYPALPVNYINASKFEARTRFSSEKLPGELFDSFRKFALFDRKDLGSQYGRINNLEVLNGIVAVIQDLAVSTIPILQQQVVTSTAGDQTALGTGGVIDRYDVVSTNFGCQHKWSVTRTEYGIAWWDGHKKAIVLMSFGGGVAEVGYLEGVSSAMKEAFVEMEGNAVLDADKILHSPTFAEESDRPLMSVGVVGAYNPKNKMTYLSFKFFGQKVVSGPLNGYISKDFTVGFLHSQVKQQFIGFYDWNFCIAHTHNDFVLSVNNPKNTTQYLPADIFGYSFVKEETIKISSRGGIGTSYDTTEYICIADVTLDNNNKYPLGASGSTSWVAVNSTNELWVNNQPALLGQTIAPEYKYNSWFGKVVTNVLKFVVNPETPDPFEVQWMEQETPHNVNYTAVRIESETQTAADESISSTNRNYKFFGGKLTHNLPLSNSGRIFNNFLYVTFEKKNWTTNPTIISTSVKILKSVTSFFNMKK